MKYFSATSLIFFLNMVKILTSKIMAKILKEMKIKIVKMTKNMNQKQYLRNSKLQEVAYRKSSQSIKALEVFRIDQDVVSCLQKLQHKIVQKLVRTMRRHPCGVMFKAMDCRIVVSEFVLQSHYYVHFRANTLGKCMNPLNLQAMG